LLPLAKVIAPLILAEAAKFGVQTGLKKIRKKLGGGRGLHPAGAGLKLAGQGHRRRRVPINRARPGPKRRKARFQVIKIPGIGGIRLPVAIR
jgi:hypothetical protein